MSKNDNGPLGENDVVVHDIERRSFMELSSLALLGSPLIAGNMASPVSATMLQPTTRRRSYFRTDTYTEEDLNALYGADIPTPAKNVARSVREVRAGDRTGSQHMVFYYDNPADRQFINPLNVKPSLTAGKYSLDVTILNSHTSQSDFDTIWKKFKHDAQMQLSLTAPSDETDELTWTLMNGIDIFLGADGLKGADKRLKAFVENNKPTSKFRPSEKIEVLTGAGKFQLQVAAERKDSWWRKLLTIGGAALNSPLFATLPIPKLLPQGVQFATAVLNHLSDTEPLVPMWTSARIPFKLYDGATPASPFTMRPGYWLTIDRTYAEKNLDEQKNLKGHLIDIAGEFFEVKTTSGQPVDANYTVLQLDFPAIK